jgi:hypothetical protein
MTEKNGNGTWTRWIMGILIALFGTIATLYVNAQGTRDANQDVRIAAHAERIVELQANYRNIESLLKRIDSKIP